ncbi:hypothetical protein PIB30_014044 [Stylosanthes scabra]|uniref:Uncharacterized protein n=1 Tax=Stylosanthes scabra TaxID=79078 RepID=A0ABU6Z375_9FABA|nr:hypothetical protein [Stylosanthes scabra]
MKAALHWCSLPQVQVVGLYGNYFSGAFITGFLVYLFDPKKLLEVLNGIKVEEALAVAMAQHRRELGFIFDIVLFKCIWAETTTPRGLKKDHSGLTNDVDDKEWSVVVHVKPRDLFDMGEDNELADVGFTPEPGLNLSRRGDIENLQLAREENN